MPSSKQDQSLLSDLSGILETLTEFQSGNFDTIVPAGTNPNLKPLIDKINETAKILATQARAQTQKNSTHHIQYSKSFFENAFLGLNLCEMDGHWVQSNKAFLDMIGYSSAEAAKLDYWQLTPKKYHAMEKTQLEALASNGWYGPYEKEFIRKDGTLIPVRLNGFIIKKDGSKNGKKLIWSIIEDLSNFQTLQANLQTKLDELREQTIFLNNVLESIPTAVFLKDAKDSFKIKFWNKAAEKIFEIPREEILEKTAQDLWPTEQAALYLAADIKVVRENRIIDIPEEPSQSKSRGIIYLHTKKIPIRLPNQPETSLLLCCCEDITDTRINRINLERIKNKLATITDNLPGPVSIIDTQGRYTFASRVYEKWYDKNPEQIVGRTIQEILAPEIYSQLKKHIDDALSGKKVGFEFLTQTSNDRKIPVYMTYIPRFDSQGVPDGFFAYGIDISEQKKSALLAEKEKNKTDALMRGLNESVAIVTTDLQGQITYINRKFVESSGYSAEELIGSNMRILNSNHHPKEFFKDLWTTISADRVWRGEMCDKNKDGSTSWVDATIVKTLNEIGQPQYLCLRVNITEKKDAQARLIESEKLASLGELAAGIAHEINNPVGIISLAAQVIPKISNTPEKLTSKLETIEKSCERITKIVSGLRKFARKSDKKELSDHSFRSIAEETLTLTEAKSKAFSTPVTLTCNTTSNIYCDEVEIEQVFVNLINNAIDAVQTQPSKWVKLEVTDDNFQLVVRVIDSGPGIPEEIQRKMFEPFFTTKKIGVGTGLGLSITKGILEDHRATITIKKDHPNTCFEIRFPIAAAKIGNN